MKTEGGNIWFCDPEPPEMTWYEAIVIYSGLFLIGAGGLALVAGVIGWVYQTFFN